MKTRITLPFAVALVLALGVLPFNACKKKEEAVPQTTNPATGTDNEQNSATDQNVAENLMSEVESMGAEVSENGSVISAKGTAEDGITGQMAIESAPCATVLVGSRAYTVDFGTSGCIGSDGKTRTGKLVYDFSTSTPTSAIHYRNPGFVLTVSSQNYVVDNYSVNIVNKTITNTTPTNIPTGYNPGTNLTWAITGSVNISKPNNGGTITWSCSRTKELMNTSDTTCYRGQAIHIEWGKAIVKLNGSASGVNAQNESYTAVASNLIRSFQCSPDLLHPHRHPFIGGTLTYTPGNRFPRIINYGNGTSCDLNATLTINNNTWNIVL